ncbi:SRPBCC domain-containing protein [Spirillospora sp. NPDC052269]
MTDGTIQRDGDRALFTYERRLDHPVAEVWRVITTPSEISQWMGVEVEEYDLRPDGKIVMVHMGTQRVEDRVIKVEPPHRLEHTYFNEMNPSAVVIWKLDEAGGGSTVTLTHSMDLGEVRAAAQGQEIDPVMVLARNGAGWHHLLDMIELRLRGERIPEWTEEDRKALQKHYAQLVP